jgi:hypothetical protein
MNKRYIEQNHGKRGARQMADALRRFDGLHAVAVFEVDHGGWCVKVYT